MIVRFATLGAAVLLAAAPAAAQERGTVEFGAFANYSLFDSSLTVNNGFGGGGRVGAFLLPRLSVEFDVGMKQLARPDQLRNVDVEAFAARLTAVPVVLGPLSILLGAGIIHTDIQGVNETDGGQALLGARLALSQSLALRVDGLADFNKDGTRNQSVQIGLSVFRHPAAVIRTVTRDVPGPAAPPVAQRPDSVSAAETARLRQVEADYRALLATRAASTPDAATISEIVHFAHDMSTLNGSAIAALDRKVAVMQANSGMRLVVTGHASEPGTDAYNAALGMRRAEAVSAYLVSRGIAAARIDVASAGRRQPVAAGGSDAAQGANRRAEFHVTGTDQ